ncbi:MULTISPECIES: MATE family efflux transporter [unclassified Granulicatella]|uniref:MATE family efflux transporter n=1 Tax=unclassified Granulicatella TaxID=2630493 RepID=UPI0013D50B14|nr:MULTISPECIES: MATE family efflux transporter [unclassified Granulicatella]MBS4750089.1 MATE family efflux transporter [Carnobacteriaceae bacterium zg-ZUI78]QMI86263.1 MATE family efflux transporter [Carnobacteriaceae bacterium zg-84]
MSNKIQINDLTKEVVKIAWPVFIELLLGSLFGVINMMMVGQIPDSAYATAAMASIGLTNQPLFLCLAFVQALNVGGTAVISRYYGAKKLHRIPSVLKHIMLISIVCFILPLSVLGWIFAHPVLLFLGAQPDAINIATDYFRLLMIAFIFQGFTMTISAALRGVGETKIPMRNNIIANLCNVFFNSILIYGLFGLPALHLMGTGIATILANMIAACLMFRYLISGKGRIKFSLKEKFHFDYLTVQQLIKIGLPSAMEQLIFRSGAMIFTMIVAGLGTGVYAAHQIGLNIWTLSIAPSQAFGISASVLVGKELGAKAPEIAQRCAIIVRKLAFIVACIMGGIFFLFGKWIVLGYTSSDTIMANMLLIMPLLAFVQPFLADNLAMTGALRGAGDTIWPMIATLIGVFIIRVALGHLFVSILHYGIVGAWWALAINQIVTWLVVLLRYRTGKWKAIQI